MTEDEAKTKWCPFARVDSTAANRPDASGSYAEAGWPPCIGSACMAWRWNNGAPVARSRRAIGIHVWRGMSPKQRAVEPVIRPLDIPETWTLTHGDLDDPEAPPKWIEPDAEVNARRDGRCGLAGAA